MSEQASRFIGSVPEIYDQFLGPRLFAGYAADLAVRVAGLAPTAVLELAAGTGIVTRLLRDQLPAACTLIATDLNPPMLETAKGKFSAGERVVFEQADACALPFDDASFDVLACQFGVMFFPDKQRAYEEARRILRPGGSYLFSVWKSWEANPFARIAHTTVANMFADNPPGFYRVPFSYYDRGHIESALKAAGFAAFSIDSVEFEAAIGDPADFARGLVFGNPLAEEVSILGGDPRQVESELAEALEQQLGDQLYLQALVIEAR